MLNTLRTGMSAGASLTIAKWRRKLWVGSCAYHESMKRMASMFIPVNAVVMAARSGFDWLRVLSIVVGTVLAMLVMVPVAHRVHHGRDSARRCLHKVSESQAAGGDAASVRPPSVGWWSANVNHVIVCWGIIVAPVAIAGLALHAIGGSALPLLVSFVGIPVAIGVVLPNRHRKPDCAKLMSAQRR